MLTKYLPHPILTQKSGTESDNDDKHDTIKMTILNTSSSSSPSSSVSSASSLSSSSTSTTSSPCTSFDVVLLPQPRPHPLILDDEQVWQAWFDYPAKQEMTLHRWAQNLQSELREYILSLSPSPTKHQIAHLLHLSHRTAAALKILILGSILLVRGITPGPLIGKTLFTTLLGERYNDTTMFDTKSNGDEGMRLVENERMLSRSVIEASKLKENGDLLSSMGRLSAALEHYGLALVRLTPWNPSIISIELSQQTGFAELDHTIVLAIAHISLSMTISLPPWRRNHLTKTGTRLHRLTQASCDYIRSCSYPFSPSPSLNPTPTPRSDHDVLDWVNSISERADEIAGLRASTSVSGAQRGGEVRDPWRLARRISGDSC